MILIYFFKFYLNIMAFRRLLKIILILTGFIKDQYPDYVLRCIKGYFKGISLNSIKEDIFI